MAVITATALATVACQGCVQTRSYAVAPVSNSYDYTVPTNETRSVALAPDQSSFVYSGTFESTETVPRLAFEAPESYSGPIDLSSQDRLSTSRLYSSGALTELASEREQDNLTSTPRNVRTLTAEISLSASAAQTGLGFDVGVAPRVSFSRDGAFATRRIGGEVRIGQNFDKRGAGDPGSSWYFFAGADGEALVWEPGDSGYISGGDMALRDKVTVGDMQAGIAFQRGPGQISFSYIRREVEYRERNLGASENEDFAGVSFTIRR